jgi:hypothetical protein
MKKLLILACALSLVVGMTMSAQAWVITFDENDIELGDTITDQYFIDDGVTWNAAYGNTVTQGSSFPNPFTSDGKILHYAKPARGLIDLADPADFLKFDFRRPAESGDIYLQLYLDDTLVHDFGRIGWDDGSGWVTFTYPGTYGSYDQIDMTSDTRFVIDNVSNVPIPASLWLLGSGLGLLPLLRSRIGKRGIS